MRTRMILATLVAVAAATLTACSNDDSSSPKADFNDADVTFAQEMIPHHRQAIVMSDVAETRAESPEVRDLAARIRAAQKPEIDTMSRWLKSWGKGVPSDNGHMGGMDHSDGDDDRDSMRGMMSDDDMDELRDGSGASFDRMFLTMMIEHHEGAVEMAKTEQDDGKHADAVALAATIEKDQTAEIAEMKDLLAG